MCKHHIIGRKNYLPNKTYLTEVSKRTVNGNFTTNVLVLNKHNQLGFQYDWGAWIRINIIKAENTDTLKLMLDDLKQHALNLNYPAMRYADSISDEYADALIEYGFIETPDVGDAFNRYFWLHLNEEAN